MVLTDAVWLLLLLGPFLDQILLTIQTANQEFSLSLSPLSVYVCVWLMCVWHLCPPAELAQSLVGSEKRRLQSYRTLGVSDYYLGGVLPL